MAWIARYFMSRILKLRAGDRKYEEEKDINKSNIIITTFIIITKNSNNRNHHKDRERE